VPPESYFDSMLSRFKCDSFVFVFSFLGFTSIILLNCGIHFVVGLCQDGRSLHGAGYWCQKEDESGPWSLSNFGGQVASRDAHLPPTMQGDDSDLLGRLVPTHASHCRRSHWGSLHPRYLRVELSTCFVDVMIPPNHAPFRVVLDQIGAAKSWNLECKVCILHLCSNII
jgi:hypothetical protein